MSQQKNIFIAVIGGNHCSSQEYRLAEEVGRELAKRGVILICGGLGGIMRAACQGADSEGGLSIGILPGDDRRKANPHIKIPIVTGMGEARNVIVVKSAQAVIAVGGKYGTLSEISIALQRGIPVIGLGTWSLSRKHILDDSITLAENAIDAVNKAMNLINN